MYVNTNIFHFIYIIEIKYFVLFILLKYNTIFNFIEIFRTLPVWSEKEKKRRR